MTGWHITVSRQQGDRTQPATASERASKGFAIWQTPASGLRWIEQLVEEGRAVGSIGSGYPGFFSARAGDLLPQVLAGPPEAREHWASGEGDILGEGWHGQTWIDKAVAEACDPDEWLAIEVWDES